MLTSLYRGSHVTHIIQRTSCYALPTRTHLSRPLHVHPIPHTTPLIPFLSLPLQQDALITPLLEAGDVLGDSAGLDDLVSRIGSQQDLLQLPNAPAAAPGAAPGDSAVTKQVFQQVRTEI